MIDYCEDPALCGMYATCKNLEPGYECECVEGYYRQKGKCVPADPCKTNNGGCDDNASCYSQIVGYEVNHQCKCKPGTCFHTKIQIYFMKFTINCFRNITEVRKQIANFK